MSTRRKRERERETITREKEPLLCFDRRQSKVSVNSLDRQRGRKKLTCGWQTASAIHYLNSDIRSSSNDEFMEDEKRTMAGLQSFFYFAFK